MMSTFRDNLHSQHNLLEIQMADVGGMSKLMTTRMEGDLGGWTLRTI